MATDAWPITRDLAPDVAGAVAAEELVQVFRVHYVGLCRLACLIIGDPALAEDAVQEAFMKTYAGWRRVREPGLVHLYMRRAVINVSRSKSRRRSVEGRANALFQARDRRNHADDTAADGFTVADAVRALPRRQRATVVLRYYLDLPEAEIAETLGTSVGTVKSQLAKARRSIEKVVNGPGSA